MAQPLNVPTRAGCSASDIEISLLRATLHELQVRSGARVSRCVLTLVALTSDAAATAHARSVSRTLAERHPLRVLILQRTQDAGTDVRAMVTVQCDATDAGSICLTEVVVPAGTDPVPVRAVVDAVRRPGLPTVTWCVDRMPPHDAPDLYVGDGVVVDSCGLTASAVKTLRGLAAHTRVVDLTWVRLQPWRELVAGLFATEQVAAFLPAVHRAQVGGDGASRALLAGWLACRLSLPADRIALLDTPAPSVRLQAERNGTAAVFMVEPAEETDEIIAAAVVEGGPSHRRRLPAPRWPVAYQLDLALFRRDHHPEGYLQAVTMGADLGFW